MAEEDTSDSTRVVFSIEEPEPEEANSNEPVLETLDPISQWCASINYASEDHHNCNPFASTSFVSSPVAFTDAVAVGRRSSVSDWLSDSDSDRDMSCFVTDLFERGHSSELKREDLAEIEGFEVEVGGDEIGELSVGSRVGGLRIAEFDSESDCEDGDVRVLNFDSLRGGDDRVNNPCLEEDRSLYEEFDWEEVEERVNERENLSIVIDDEDQEEVEVILAEAEAEADYYETVSEAVQNFEWEIMLAINSLASNASLERNNGDSDTVPDLYLAIQDDYVYAIGDGVEYDALFEQFIESESALKGSPPAAKSAVEGLPCVELTIEELKKDDLVCAVCKDRILVEDKVKRLPCCHYYHSDCIVPWLGIRNSCPVCRFELPTDDPDYERRKSQRARRAPPRNSQVVLNSELLA